MNFFAHQAKARSNTTKLMVLFALAVISLITITLLFLIVFLAFFNDSSFHEEMLNVKMVMAVTGTVVGTVLIAWLYKSVQLASGGKAIAEAMNGKLLSSNTENPDEKKVLNVVEEMAIASGITVPPVYLFNEPGINAFAAGYSNRDAVIGITQGSIRALNREELQGVIAHEFSHIFNGDMRLNIRLITVLHGILVIGMIGESLLELPGRHGNSRNESWFFDDKPRGHGNAGFYMLGVGLYVIGYLGHFFGALIKAAVGREREFLADASAVQYTRNPQGIGNALRKIGGYPLGSYIKHGEAKEISHLFFSDAAHKKFLRGLSTHPPLRERIKRVDPSGGNKFIKVTLPEEAKINPHLLRESRMGINIDPDAYKKPGPLKQLEPIQYMGALAFSGNPTPQHVEAAQQLLQDIPAQLKKLAHDTYDVQALIYCFLLDKHRSNVHEQQLTYLEKNLPIDIYREILRIKDLVTTLPPRHRLPLMDIAIATLKQLNQNQYTELKTHMMSLIKADKVIDLTEWSLYRMVTHHLEDKVNKRIGHKSLPALHRECQRLLSAIALASSDTTEDAAKCFQKGWAMLKLAPAELINDCLRDTPALDHAVKRANLLHPLKKPLLIKACCAALHQEDDPEGIELIRTLVDGLDVPMPPLLENQKLC